MVYCAAATACSSPAACSSSLTTAELAQLLVLVLSPVALSLWLPALFSLWPRRGGAHRSVTTLGSPRDGLTGCGVSIPRVCATSGMLLVVVGLAAGFVPTFFMLLLSEHPCGTAVGGCGSISCACGNFMAQGYVWMQVMLVTGAVALLREAALLPGAPKTSSPPPSPLRLPPLGGAGAATTLGPSARRGRFLLLLGSLCFLLTAVYPEHFSMDPTSPITFYAIGYAMHGLGLFLALVVLVFAPFGWLVRAARHLPPARRAPVIALRATHLATLLGYLVAYAFLRTHADVSDYCSPITSEAACGLWPDLPPASCAALGHQPRARGHELPVAYSCGWLNGTLSATEQMLLPPAYAASHSSACRKEYCPLYANGVSIGLEFGALLLFAAYVSTYTMRDTAWVLALGGAEGAASPLYGEDAARAVLVHEAVVACEEGMLEVAPPAGTP